MRARVFTVVGGAAVLVAAFTATGVASAQPGDGAPSASPGLQQKAEQGDSVRVIVQVRRGADRDAVAATVRQNGGTVRRVYHRFPLLVAEVGLPALQGLARSPQVTAVQEDVAEPLALASSIPLINADDVQRLGWTGAGRGVAILDTGIDRDHPFFGSRIVAEACFSTPADTNEASLCPNGTTAQTGAGAADAETAQCLNGTVNMCDHGSHVAGIAAGSATGVAGAPGSGVAPGADIAAVQVFTRFNAAADCTPDPTPCIRTYVSDQISGLEEVLDLDSGGTTIDAANMSISNAANNGTACDADTRKVAIDDLLAAGIATVIAAGNSGHPNGVGAPGCISTAVTVGATDDSDAVANFSNRGGLLDLFAPGVSVDSSVPDDAWGNLQGTSMAAPHVAGAYAALRQAYPTASPATLLGHLRNTGVPISYDTSNPADGVNDTTTPRIDLLAALQAGNNPPSLTADSATVAADEGSQATNGGTFSDPEGNPVSLAASVGTVTNAGGGRWSWSFGTEDGPAQSQLVTISGTDDRGETGSVTFALTVANLPPAVTIDARQANSISEGNLVDVLAHFSDPGKDSPYAAQLDWGTGETSAGTVVVTQLGLPQRGDVTGSHRYGDNGSFTVKLTVTDKDGGAGSASFLLAVANVAPTATIDESGAVLVNGVPTLLAHAGQPVALRGRSTDPGSDDLALSWDWADGAPSPDVTTTYLVNPPATDPFPSPSIQPRDVTDVQSHAFGTACFYRVGFRAADDDGGTAADSANVVITGTADKARSLGYWLTQYKQRPTASTAAQLKCLLDVASYMSAVYGPLTAADAVKILGSTSSQPRALLSKQLLAAWLNFANGSYDLATPVDTNGDGVVDTTFRAALTAAETVYLNPSSTNAQLLTQQKILERINLRDGG